MIVIQKSQNILEKISEHFVVFLFAVTRRVLAVDVMTFLHQGRGDLHRTNEEYADTLLALSVWSDPCGLGKKW